MCALGGSSGDDGGDVSCDAIAANVTFLFSTWSFCVLHTLSMFLFPSMRPDAVIDSNSILLCDAFNVMDSRQLQHLKNKEYKKHVKAFEIVLMWKLSQNSMVWLTIWMLPYTWIYEQRTHKVMKMQNNWIAWTFVSNKYRRENHRYQHDKQNEMKCAARSNFMFR